MKHLPVPEDPSVVFEQPEAEKPEPPPDSAYSSGPDEKVNTPDLIKEQNTRPESTLGPLPIRIEAPPNHARVSNDQNAKRDGAMSMKSARSLSIKSFFPRRWRSRKLLTS